jgi:hypothetical protein
MTSAGSANRIHRASAPRRSALPDHPAMLRQISGQRLRVQLRASGGAGRCVRSSGDGSQRRKSAAMYRATRPRRVSSLQRTATLHQIPWSAKGVPLKRSERTMSCDNDEPWRCDERRFAPMSLCDEALDHDVQSSSQHTKPMLRQVETTQRDEDAKRQDASLAPDTSRRLTTTLRRSRPIANLLTEFCRDIS